MANDKNITSDQELQELFNSEWPLETARSNFGLFVRTTTNENGEIVAEMSHAVRPNLTLDVDEALLDHLRILTEQYITLSKHVSLKGVDYQTEDDVKDEMKHTWRVMGNMLYQQNLCDGLMAVQAEKMRLGVPLDRPLYEVDKTPAVSEQASAAVFNLSDYQPAT